MKLIIILSTVLLSHLTATTAPHPGTSTSGLLNINKDKFYSNMGFSISSENTNWNLVNKHRKNSIIVAFAPEKKSNEDHALFTVRVDALKKNLKLSSYIKKWISDYPKLGFSILRSQKVKVGTKIGYLIDLKHQTSHKSLRQVIFVKHKKAAVLTCRADNKLYSKYLNDCNSLMKNFNWQ